MKKLRKFHFARLSKYRNKIKIYINREKGW